MNFGQSISSVFKQYFVFSGRACKSEYWWFTLFTAIAWLVLLFINPILWIIFILAIFVPSIAVLVRRMHDTGRSAWWLLLSIVPFGSIVLLIFTILGGSQGDNKYGPDPLGSLESIIPETIAAAGLAIDPVGESPSSPQDEAKHCGTRLEPAANFCRICGNAA